MLSNIRKRSSQLRPTIGSRMWGYCRSSMRLYSYDLREWRFPLPLRRVPNVSIETAHRASKSKLASSAWGSCGVNITSFVTDLQVGHIAT